MTALAFEPASFDAVVAFYSLTHVPRDDVPGCSERSATGCGPAARSSRRWASRTIPGGIEEGWLGVDMYFSHFSARKNRRLVEEAGLVVDSADVVAEPEDRHDARFLWIVAHAP